MATTLSDLAGLVGRAADRWLNSRAPTMGAALAYYTAFTLAPLLVLLLRAAAVLLRDEAARGRLSVELLPLVGPQVAKPLAQVVEQAGRPDAGGPLATAVGVAALLLGASGVIAELQTSLNAVWGVEGKPGRGWQGLLRDRFLSLATVLGALFLLLVSLVANAAVGALAGLWTPAGGAAAVVQAVNFLLVYAVVTVIFALIFRYLPDARTAWADVWLGAAVTAGLFALGRWLLGLYLTHAAPDAGYGAAGALLVVLTWVYYSAQIFLFGAALTREYAETNGRGVTPARHARAVPTAGNG